jgi:ABC-type multidrug transport system ATPase subunit
MPSYVKKGSSVCILSSPVSTEGTYRYIDMEEPTIAVLDEAEGRHHDDGAAAEYTFSWSDISYSVPVKGKAPKHILRGVSGRCRPGEMTAVMGPSGSGKTTLLDILADRVGTGSIEGSIELNGTPRNEKTFRAVASYVAQEDSLLGSFTVVETLRMAAKLSLPSSITSAMIEERVDLVITEMGLRSCQDTIVGDIFRKGLSGGQRRRLSIAIELLSNPSILLLDEPTSGLDSSATFNVMKFLSQLSRDHHKTVIFTIHQPSSLVYDMFTNILIMSSGQPVYCGPREGAITHFASAGYTCPTYSNPAEYFIELVNADFEGHADVPQLVQACAESAMTKDLGTRITEDRAKLDRSASQRIEEEAAAKSASPSAWRQFCVILHRCSVNNIRNPGIYWVRLFMYFMLSFMVGTMYLSTNKDLTVDDMVPLLFYVQAFLVFMSVAVLPFFIEQRSVFLRERTNSRLNVGSYVVANFIAGIPGIFLIALLSTLLVVLLAGMNSFGWFLLNLFLSLIVAESLMHVIGAAVPHYIIGIALGAGIFGMFMLCEGFMVPRHAIPDYWIWAYYLAFHSYSFESFVYKQFVHDGSPRAAQILARMGMENVDVPRNMAILAGYAVVLELLFAFILYKFHTGRR